MNVTIDTPQQIRTEVKELLLVRLLSQTKAAVKFSDVRKALNSLLGSSLPESELQDAVHQLREKLLIEPKKLLLTPVGRTEALRILRIDSLPEQCNWTKIQKHYLLPLLVGRRTEGMPSVAITPEVLITNLLINRLNLQIPRTAKLGHVMVAMLGKELGFPHETDLKILFRHFLNQQIGSTELLSTAQLEKAIPRYVLKISTPRQDAISSHVGTRSQAALARIGVMC